MNKVYVDGIVYRDRGKSDAAFRTVHLQQKAVDCLGDLPRPLNSDGLVFAAPKGGFINIDNWRKRVWAPALEAAMLDYRPLYQMRHTFATLALAAGADIYWVSRQLGHADIRTTLKFYARFQRAVDERNLRMLDAFAAGSDAEVANAG